MALLNFEEKENATGRVAEIYDIMIKNMGFVPNAFKLYSPSEFLLDQQFRYLMYYIQNDHLSGKLLAFIRLLVSEKEDCAYCVGMNTGILLHYGVRPEEVAEIRIDPTKAPLDEKELALLLFVLKVTGNSNAVEKNDIENLKLLGWSESDILTASFHGTTQVGVDKLFNAFKLETDR